MNFDGPVRVVDTAGSGTATVTLSFDAWKEGSVEPTTHSITVLPPKAGPKPEPVAENFIGSLVCPDRKSAISSVIFSPDGSRLFMSSQAAGVAQIWDVSARKELHRIEAAPGFRAWIENSLVTADWKTLYFPVQRRTITPIERDGKRAYRMDYVGEIQVWDLATGKQQPAIKPAEGSAPMYAKLAPSRRFLVWIEQPSVESTEKESKQITVALDLETGEKRKLADGFNSAIFAPDSRAVLLTDNDYAAKTSAIRLVGLASGKQLAELHPPEKERYFSPGSFSPDGSVVPLYLLGKKGGPLEIWFRDAHTLQDRGKLVSKGDPDRDGFTAAGAFTRDGKLFVVPDFSGNILVWDVIGRRVKATIPTGSDWHAWDPAVSPDGNVVAIGWMPKLNKKLGLGRNTDPQDLPQPRIALIDLTGKASTRVLIAPHGYALRCAFSPDGKTLAVGSQGAVHLFDLTK